MVRTDHADGGCPRGSRSGGGGGEPGNVTPIFRVRSVAAAAESLAAGAVATSEIVTVAGRARLLTLQDPDGNTLMLQEIV